MPYLLSNLTDKNMSASKFALAVVRSEIKQTEELMRDYQNDQQAYSALEKILEGWTELELKYCREIERECGE